MPPTPATLRAVKAVHSLRAVAKRRRDIALPSFARVEVACALARRLRDGVAAHHLADALLSSPLVREHLLDAVRLRQAVTTGTQSYLRGADALCAALAAQLDATLVAWDDELVQRAGAQTPTAWLAAHS